MQDDRAAQESARLGRLVEERLATYSDGPAKVLARTMSRQQLRSDMPWWNGNPDDTLWESLAPNLMDVATECVDALSAAGYKIRLEGE